MISFRKSARQAVVSAHTLSILERLCAAAGLRELTISSTQRNAAEQARAMYNNLEATSVAAQLALYAAPGREVIAAYVKAKAKSLTPDAVVAEMTAAIERIGPARVSRHCANPAVLNVIDIPPSTMTTREQRAFVAAVEQEMRAGAVTKFLRPPQDPAFHLEIPQRTTSAVAQSMGQCVSCLQWDDHADGCPLGPGGIGGQRV
jgi:hypothetical protein